MTDGELVLRAVAGDRSAFEKLARRHFSALYAIVLAHTGDVDDAEDVCQDVLVRAWTRLSQCREPSRFGAWLMRIGRNESRRRLAWRRVRKAVGLNAVRDRAAPRTPETDLARTELRRELLAALNRLKPRAREVVLLHDMEGYTHQEIADRLGLSVVMSRRHLSDARAQLRRRLESADA